MNKNYVIDVNNEWLDVIGKDLESPNKGEISAIHHQNNKSNSCNLDISSTSSFYSVSKAPSVICKRHGQNYLGVETGKFKLICKKCKELKIASELELIDNIDLTNELQDEIFCDNHVDTKSTFFCNDCNLFLCKSCYADEHRKHNCNLPNYLAIKFKEEINSNINELSNIKPGLENSLEEFSKMNEKIKIIRDNSLKNIKEVNNKIASICKNKFDNINKEVDKMFLGLDVECENIITRLQGLLKKQSKYTSELEELIKIINEKSENLNERVENKNNLQQINDYKENSITSNSVYLVCYEKQKQQDLMKSIKILLEDSKNLLCYNTPKMMQELDDKKSEIDKKIFFFFKKMKIFENSIQSSISNGMKNSSMFLRRFTKFGNKGLKYYKTSSFIFQTDSQVLLTGVALCGLYISSKELLDKNSKVYKEVKERGVIPIEIKISEIKLNPNNKLINNSKYIPNTTNNYSKTVKNTNSTQEEYELKSKEENFLYGIVNRWDPICICYLKKGVYIKQNTRYLLTISNLDNNPMINIIYGEVNKTAISNSRQTIRCNCTGVVFDIETANGVESDFNEFNMGIIASLVFCKAD